MILLTVGTWHNGYDRLLKAIDDLASNNIITEDIVAQIGNSRYAPKHFSKCFDFCSPDEFTKIVEEASIIITHAGVGSMVTAIQFNKPVIVLPRKPELGEVDNDHQFDTAEQFEKENLVLVALSEEDLKDKIEKAHSFSPSGPNSESKIKTLVGDFVETVNLKKNQEKLCKNKIWPYYILNRTDSDITNDLKDIVDHFSTMESIDSIVFIPNAGNYLADLFKNEFGDRFSIKYVAVQRKSTINKPNLFKRIIFNNILLSNFFRHFEVLMRRIKFMFNISQKMIKQQSIDFEVHGKNVLVIDDSVDTGTTLRIVKDMLLERGAKDVKTACISNHLIPDKVNIDYSVYRYALLRTKNSRDYRQK